MDKKSGLQGSCHCGAVTVEVPRLPKRLTNCNCSICRRYATLWGYYDRARVSVKAKRGALESYSWGNKRLKFVRCAHCGCVVNWERAKGAKVGRCGVNFRNFEPELIEGIRVRRLDGASGSWKFLD